MADKLLYLTATLITGALCYWVLPKGSDITVPILITSTLAIFDKIERSK